MKAIKAKDLKPGMQVYDTKKKGCNSILLEFVKKRYFSYKFKIIKGSSRYVVDNNGLIPFSGDEIFYLPETD